MEKMRRKEQKKSRKEQDRAEFEQEREGSRGNWWNEMKRDEIQNFAILICCSHVLA